MPLTDKLAVVTQAVVDHLKNASDYPVPPDDIHYGDRNKIPRYPAVCIFSGGKDRELGGNTQRTENNITVFLIIYYAGADSVGADTKAVDELTDLTEEVLHRDLQMRGTVTSGYVRTIDPGFAVRSGALIKATRIRWVGYNMTSLVKAV